jgi:aspartyl-tRNA(Asn)/glutamyl-tRNA(Gln) amidotransferase subunit A
MSINETAKVRIAGAKRAHEKHRDLNAWAHIDWPNADRQAEALTSVSTSAVAGLTFGVKDLFNVAGMPSKAGTQAALPAFGEGESPLVTRLIAAGAIVLGKTNMHEIALGATGENPHTGDVKNPFDFARQSGGSSSGSGVAVATQQCDFALGSDTGGSVRIPAAFCGIVGFKPSFGVLSLEGGLYLSPTCDHAGILAPTVQMCSDVFSVLIGGVTSTVMPAKKLKLAVPREWLQGRLGLNVRDVFENVLSKLTSQAAISNVATPELPKAWICYSPIVRAEAAFVHQQVLAGYGGKPPGAGFSTSVLEPMLAGQKISAQEYLAARAMRADVRKELDQILMEFDALILPTSAIVPPLRGQTMAKVEGGEMTVREAVLGQTLPFSLCGLPTISIPMGMVDGLPVGLQIVSRRGNDAALLQLAQALRFN